MKEPINTKEWVTEKFGKKDKTTQGENNVDKEDGQIP